jgi:NhaA family Na+:H+ antiporter
MAVAHSDNTARRPIERLVRPFQAFAARESSGGILLLLATVVALVWANSPWAKSYFSLWHTTVTLGFGENTIVHDLHFWVNDALMALFFFVVGLEIKREFLVGELASPRQAALPIVAALGGVLVPAAIYSLLNAGGTGAQGWGIPMATDIAFVIGVMALLGSRVPTSLKVFLTALAIVDDIAAVLVIALFYTGEISSGALGIATLCLTGLAVANRLGVRHPLPYALLGVLLWGAVWQSGVHATIAGVLLAMTIPARTELNPNEFLKRARAVLDHFECTAEREKTVMNDEEQQAAIEALEDSCEQVQPPLHRLEHALHPWVTFFVMPVFALANAGLVFDERILASVTQPIPLGVVLGLLLGKPIGITLASWFAVRLRLGALPAETTWLQIHGAGWLGGIGFTMSIFVAGLAFEEEALLNMAKLGIFTASLLAGIVGSVLLLRNHQPASKEFSARAGKHETHSYR